MPERPRARASRGKPRTAKTKPASRRSPKPVSSTPKRATGQLSAHEAAAVLGLKLSTLYAYSHRGEVTSRRVDGRLLFDRAEIEGLAQARAERAEARRLRALARAAAGRAERRRLAPAEIESTLSRRLLEPLVLILLRDGPAHGYDLRLRLLEAGLCRVDPGSLYRELRAMHRERLVRDNWKEGLGGPPRRSYSITNKGNRRLELWIELLERGPVYKLLRHARRQRGRGAPSWPAGEKRLQRPEKPQ